MRPTGSITLALAAALLAACNAPQPDVPDEPPSPQAAAAATPGATPAGSTQPRPARPLDRMPTTPDLPPPGTDNPVWKQAAERGIAFRAVGQEPGWYVEIGGGAAPTLHAVLEYGERTLDAADVQALAGGQGYRGTAGDGTGIVVRTMEGPCFDGMSGHRFPTKVELTIGETTYTGCGAHL